jgi:hypothetical protein
MENRKSSLENGYRSKYDLSKETLRYMASDPGYAAARAREMISPFNGLITYEMFVAAVNRMK